MSLFPRGDFQIRLSRLVLAATVLHITFVIGIFLIGRFGIFPNTFDTHGIGTSFAIDSKSYRIEAEALADSLRKNQFSEWFSHPRLHVKLYSLCFLVLDRVVGANILSAEPLNLACFLLTVVLIYSLGKEIFDQRVGLIAAGTVALWPSFLLHTTQMLRDPLFIAAFLLLILTFVRLLTRTLSWQHGVLLGVTGSIMCLFLWLIRGDWWELIFVILLIGTAVPLMKQVWTRKSQLGNALGALLILAAGLFFPQIVPAYRQPDEYLRQVVTTRDALKPAAQMGSRLEEPSDFWSRAPKRIGILRHKFIVRYPEAGSNIDRDVELTSSKDLIRYFPRAMIIGLFSPFPNMWFARGAQVGLAGRLLAGAEMLGVYIVEGLALVCVLFQRRRLPVWVILATVLAGVTALGFVVVNISTIYRMRYAFTMLLIVLGARGLIEVQSRLAARKPPANRVEGRLNANAA